MRRLLALRISHSFAFILLAASMADTANATVLTVQVNARSVVFAADSNSKVTLPTRELHTYSSCKIWSLGKRVAIGFAGTYNQLESGFDSYEIAVREMKGSPDWTSNLQRLSAAIGVGLQQAWEHAGRRADVKIVGIIAGIGKSGKPAAYKITIEPTPAGGTSSVERLCVAGSKPCYVDIAPVEVAARPDPGEAYLDWTQRLIEASRGWAGGRITKVEIYRTGSRWSSSLGCSGGALVRQQ